MSKEEIKEYLKRTDELELKLTGEDKDTYQWVLFGYNQCAKLLNETQRENQKLEKENKKYKEVIYKAIELLNNPWSFESGNKEVDEITHKKKWEIINLFKEVE